MANHLSFKHPSAIIWNEGNISWRTAWSSWMSAGAPRRGDRCALQGNLEATEARTVRHDPGGVPGVDRRVVDLRRRVSDERAASSPFPLELPKRCIELFSSWETPYWTFSSGAAPPWWQPPSSAEGASAHISIPPTPSPRPRTGALAARDTPASRQKPLFPRAANGAGGPARTAVGTSAPTAGLPPSGRGSPARGPTRRPALPTRLVVPCLLATYGGQSDASSRPPRTREAVFAIGTKGRRTLAPWPRARPRLPVAPGPHPRRHSP